jgi:16S rRNA (guanine527-N7)-methyltransferase
MSKEISKNLPHLSDDKKAMIQLLVDSGISLDHNQLSKLWKFHNLILKRNQEYNLTGIHDFREMILKHYVDCFIVEKIVKIPFPLLDIGTGAGFPGVPLKIIYEEEKIILAECRKQRVCFLKEVKESLALRNTEIYPHKIKEGFKARVKAVITRALEPISKTLPRISSSLEKGGLAIFMKGPNVSGELKELQKIGKEFEVLQNHPYVLPLINHRRRLIVVRKK